MYESLKYNTIWLIYSRDNSKCVPSCRKWRIEVGNVGILERRKNYCIIASDVFCDNLLILNIHNNS